MPKQSILRKTPTRIPVYFQTYRLRNLPWTIFHYLHLLLRHNLGLSWQHSYLWIVEIRVQKRPANSQWTMDVWQTAVINSCAPNTGEFIIIRACPAILIRPPSVCSVVALVYEILAPAIVVWLLIDALRNKMGVLPRHVFQFSSYVRSHRLWWIARLRRDDSSQLGRWSGKRRMIYFQNLPLHDKSSHVG